MRLLASLAIVSNTVLQAMLPGIELGILRLLFTFEFLDNLTLLLLSKLFAVNASVLRLNLGQSRSVLLLLNGSFLCRGLLLNLRRLDIVLGRIKIDLNVRLDATDLIVRLRVHDVDRVVPASILNVNRVTFVKDRVMGQLLLQATKAQ